MSRGKTNAKSVVINGRFLSQSVTGVQRYAFELLRSLDISLSERALEPLPVTVLVPPDARMLPRYSFLRVSQVGSLTGHLWEQLELPRFARGSLVFTPCGGSPIVHRPHVITIHDAASFRTPHAYTARYRAYYKTLQRYLASTAVRVLTVSDFSRRELIEIMGLASEKISYTYESGEHILRSERDPSILATHGLERGKYVLAVGSNNPNKNFAGMVEACNLLPPSEIKIAVAGRAHTAVFGDAPLLANSVRQLGPVNDSGLRTLYENACCFIFPSFYEGFGLPAMEALALGCPVVASQAASLPEILGDAVLYCDPHSPRDIASKISAVLRGEGPGREARLARAVQFRWSECARQTWAVLRAAMQV